MFRPQIQKTRVLFSLAVFCILMVYIALANLEFEEAVGYQDKMKAAEIMEECLSILYNEVNNEKISIDIDPFQTGLIFDDRDSPMITYGGSNTPSLESKQTVLKPNFAALIVDLFIKIDLTSGDTIAVGMTGSFPGANIALLSACKAMGIVPIIITSVGGSEWGAIDSNFTWLDLEKSLFNSGVISHRSKAVSLGGYSDMYDINPDNGYGGPEGKRLAEKAIKRNDIKRIVNDKNERVSDREEIYKTNINDQLLANYSAFVNIGGGVGSIGIKGKTIYGWGILDINKVAADERDYNMSGIIKEFAKNNVHLINIKQINKMIKNDDGKELIKYGINRNASKVTGEGLLFYLEVYTLNTVLIILLTLISTLGIVTAIGINSFHQINKHMNTYETESIL